MLISSRVIRERRVGKILVVRFEPLIHLAHSRRAKPQTSRESREQIITVETKLHHAQNHSLALILRISPFTDPFEHLFMPLNRISRVQYPCFTSTTLQSVHCARVREEEGKTYNGFQMGRSIISMGFRDVADYQTDDSQYHALQKKREGAEERAY